MAGCEGGGDFRQLEASRYLEEESGGSPLRGGAVGHPQGSAGMRKGSQSALPPALHIPGFPPDHREAVTG